MEELSENGPIRPNRSQRCADTTFRLQSFLSCIVRFYFTIIKKIFTGFVDRKNIKLRLRWTNIEQPSIASCRCIFRDTSDKQQLTDKFCPRWRNIRQRATTFSINRNDNKKLLNVGSVETRLYSVRRSWVVYSFRINFVKNLKNFFRLSDSCNDLLRGICCSNILFVPWKSDI